MIRETYEQGSVRNSEYREIADVSRNTAWNDLQNLTDKGIVEKKGKGRNTRYVYTI